MSRTDPVPPETMAEVETFLHWHLHLRARREGWEYALQPDCWSEIIYGPAPEWVDSLVGEGLAGSKWCPILNPTLTDLARSQGWGPANPD